MYYVTFASVAQYCSIHSQKNEKADKAKPRVIVGRLPALAGEGAHCSRDGAGGESHGSQIGGIAGLPKLDPDKEPDCRGF